eukprot:352775-Chlamydomonas_euryale.AAC.10
MKGGCGSKAVGRLLDGPGKRGAIRGGRGDVGRIRTREGKAWEPSQKREVGKQGGTGAVGRAGTREGKALQGTPALNGKGVEEPGCLNATGGAAQQSISCATARQQPTHIAARQHPTHITASQHPTHATARQQPMHATACTLQSAST